MTRARAALLLVVVGGSLIALPRKAPAASQSSSDRQAYVFVIGGVSFEEMLSALPFRELARAGGTGLMTTKTSASGVAAQFAAVGNGAIGLGVGTPTLLAKELRRSGLAYCEAAGAGPFSILADPQTPDCLGVSDPSIVVFRAGEYAPVQARDRVIDGLRGGFGSILLNDIPALPDRETMVLVVDPSRSGAMDAVGDEVTPVLMAIGRPSGLFSSSGSTRGLTSDTTRQDGLVANVDVAPTILDFFGIPIPKGMTGSPIRIDGTVDVAHLHQLHLDQRRIRLPFQLGLVAFISALGILTIAALIWVRIRGPLPTWTVSGLRFLMLCGVALMIPLMAGGLLPRLTYAVVVPFVVLSTIALALIARSARWPGPMGPFAFLGVTALAFMVVDALFGWRGLRIPLLGGTMFDGARFYGIPNAFLATLLGSSLFVATLLGPWAGTAFLFGAGLFAGFPALGADLGGAATLFLAAGLWWAIRSTSRRVVARAAGAAVIIVVGLAAVVLANRFLPGAPTHIAGFVERTGSGLAGIWHTFTSRLDVAIGQLQDVPAAWIPMLGLVVVLAAALIRPEPVGSGFAVAGLTWRDAIIVLTLAGMAAFFANDTGVAAAAPVFLYAATAMAYPSLLFIRATEMT